MFVNEKLNFHQILLTQIFTFVAPDGKRSSGLNAVWVARNRFAVLDRTRSVRRILDLNRNSQDFRPFKLPCIICSMVLNN